MKFCVEQACLLYALQIANNKGANQTVRMRRLVCTFVVRKPQKTGFLTSRPILCDIHVICHSKTALSITWLFRNIFKTLLKILVKLHFNFMVGQLFRQNDYY